MTDPQSYRSYRDLPALAGLATIEDAAKPGLGVEACVTRLKRFHYAFLRLHEILTARITAEPIYELKSAFSHHAYLCAEHVSALRQRIGEMREPPLGLDEVPHEALQIAFDEILATPTTDALLLGLYAVAFRELDAALERYQRDTNPLTDAPSVRIIRFARLELDDILSFGQRTLECVVSDEASARYGEWVGYLARLLQEAGFSPSPHGTPGQEGRGEGGLDTSQNREALACSFPSPPTPLPRSTEGEGRRRFSATPYVYDRIPKRDERFHDVWNQGVNAESFLYNPEMPAKPKTLMMLYKRLREIDVPEMMASIITETKGKPWDYYRDMSRQLWDEARHAMMGEVGFVALGVDWTKACITVNWSHRLNTECTPIERHAVLYFIEQGLMTKTGKRYEWEVGRESGLPLIATIQDFDWADEVLHAQLGRQWYIPAIGDWKTALAYGDECWSRILSNWHAVKEQGLTQHANWWPSVYREACVAWGEKPEATVLAFAETYEGARADLKNVMGSA